MPEYVPPPINTSESLARVAYDTWRDTRMADGRYIPPPVWDSLSEFDKRERVLAAGRLMTELRRRGIT